MFNEIELSSVITDIAAGPFGSNLKVSCFVPYGFPIIDGANLKGFKVTDNLTKFVTKDKARSLSRSIARRGDVVVTISGTLGQIAYIPDDSMFEEYLCSQRQFRVSFDASRVYVPYLVFYFHTKEGQSKILAFANQTGVPALSQPLKNFKKIRIRLPSYNEQRKIASVIESINDKIECNQKINDNLEQQARALFEQKFIAEDIDGEERPLYDFAAYINGAAFKPSECGDQGLPIIKIAELKNGITDSTRYYDGFKGEKYLVQNKDILFSWSGNPDTSIDIFIWTHGKAILNQHTFNVKSNTGHRWFTFLMLKYFKPEFSRIASNKQTTGLGHVTAKDLKRLTFIFNESAIDAFEREVSPFMEMVYSNMMENQRLAQLRDNLLPRLMSGEIDASNIQL